MKNRKQNLIIVIAVALIILGFGGYRYYVLNTEFKDTTATFENKVKDLEKKLTKSEEEKDIISEALYSEQSKNRMFEDQIEDIYDTVGILEKLSKTDPELLQKYSKVFFLNEHYIPSALTQIDPDYVISQKDQWVHKEVWSFLIDMLRESKRDKIDLRIVSAYRTFDEQKDLKSGYAVTYGEGTANQFSAEQGYSEHQLGTTVDFTTPELGSNFGTFNQTESYKWLQNNAYKYGFILSYPENNSYYQYEPWHWRFVGRDLAKKLERENRSFYDMDQRDIDEYLVSIFD